MKLWSLWFIGSSSELYSSSLVLWSNSILCSRLKYLCVVQVDRLFLGFQKVHHQMCSLHSIASHREWSLHHIFKSQGHSLCSVHRVQWGIVPIRWCLHLSLWFHVRSVLWFSDLIYDLSMYSRFHLQWSGLLVQEDRLKNAHYWNHCLFLLQRFKLIDSFLRLHGHDQRFRLEMLRLHL